MRYRSVLGMAVGIGASVALSALASPALADHKNPTKGSARPQRHVAQDASQQIATGDLFTVQTNINQPVRLFKPGDSGPVSQIDSARGSASNASNTPAGQVAIGQAAVVQLDLNIPVRVGSPGTEGPLTQVSRATGSASDRSGASWKSARQSTSTVGQGEPQVDSQDQTSPNADPTQIAIGQGAVAQIHVDAPVSVLSSPDDASMAAAIADEMKSAESGS